MRDRANEVRIRINDGITVPQVRLIDEKGEQLGIKPMAFAQEYAASHNLDLVEVAAQSDPPVCRIMNYSKYRYELELKAKQARKHQSQIVIKEIKFRPKVGVHDYETKKGHVLRFLQHKDKVKVTIMFRGREMVHQIVIKEIKFRPKVGVHDYETKKGHVLRFLQHKDKVKVTIMFRGREMVHPERGETLLLRLAEDIKEYGVIESKPLQDGRNMVMMLAPVK